MATDTPYTYGGRATDAPLDQDVKASKALETSAGMEAAPRKRQGGCGRCLNCFFCYIPWIPILLCAISLAAAIISLVTIRQSAKDTKNFMDDLGFSNNAIVTKIFNAIPVAVWISLIVMVVLVIAIALLAFLRANQSAVHRGIYSGDVNKAGCCERSCCYWSLLLPSYVVSAIWWILLVLVVILLMALVLWIAVFFAMHKISGYAIDKSVAVSDQINAGTEKIFTDMQNFVNQQNAQMQRELANVPPLLQAWNRASAPLTKLNFTNGNCFSGCLDVSMFQDAFGSKKCICAKESLQPLEDESIKIARNLYRAFFSTCILYLAASLLLVTLTSGNTNARRDKNELKRLRLEWQAQQQRGGQFMQSPPDVEQAHR